MADKPVLNKETVKELDVHRYMGKWYEIARFAHRFERGMEGVTAEYTLLPNGYIRVVNSGFVGGLHGRLKKAVGKAKIPDPAEPGKLKVSFFLFFYGDYYVLELDRQNYSYALIGSSSDNYLWLLSRTPQPDADTIDRLLIRASERGYDTDKLIFMRQPEK